jgi:capsular polysaccharide biosynthesis protein
LRLCSPLPRLQFVFTHAQQFNRLQIVVAGAKEEGPGLQLGTHSRYEPATSSFFIASVPDAVVDGPAGAVYDTQRRLYAPPGMFAADGTPPGPFAEPDAAGRTRVPVLATVIQTYGWMYHHWVVETLPKLVLLRDAMPALVGARNWNASHVRVLTWGQPWEAAWLDVLGIPRQATLTFDPLAGAAASTLLLPSPVQVITPSAEALQLARSAVLSALPAAGPRNLVVFASRAGERSRAVANEAELLAALAAALPALTVAVHNRSVPVTEAVAMFSRAVAVVAPHGAGLSHILFCPPGTAVVELMFMRSPPMMFWHMAAALGLRYGMAPQPRSFWCVMVWGVGTHRGADNAACPGHNHPRSWTCTRWWRCCGGC